MQSKRAILSGLLAIASALIPITLSAQNRTRFAGQYNAVDYAYGVSSSVNPLLVDVGTAAGAGTLTVAFGYTVAGDGTNFNPLATNAPITVGQAGTRETVTPSAVSCATPGIYNSCTVTATFTYAHGQGESISSGTAGLQEAINLARAFGGGGTVIVSSAWTAAGGTDTIIGAAGAYSSVTIQDTRGTRGVQYWAMQPTTLTSLAVPTTLVAANVVFAAAPVGTWANSAYYFCVTYVDALGGEGPCSLTYTQTPTLNYSVTVSSPAASAGAVGWRFYAGVGSLATAYLMPITTTGTTCKLTTLESVFPACAIGSSGVWLAPNVTTTTLKPNTVTTPTVNVNQTQPQGHTAFAYVPVASVPLPFQTNYGPFPAYGALTAGQIAVLGTVNLPTGFLNVIGRTIRVSGKVALTTLNTATLPYITVGVGWVAGLTAGAPVAICSLVPAAAGATATASESISSTMTVNAVGATAVGSAMTNGWELLVAAAGGALTGATVDTGTAAIGSLGFFAQNTLYVTYTSTTNVTAGEQLLALNVEVLQ